jgi:hypothetical protein
MRLGLKTTLVAAVVVATAALAYGELVVDMRTPRSGLTQVHALGTSISIQMGDFHDAGEAMKAKYGPSARTSLQTPEGKLRTVVDGKVVEEKKIAFKFGDVIGLLAIGPRGRTDRLFPFRLDPRKVPAADDHRVPAADVKSRFAKTLPAKYLAFDDRDATNDTCVGLSGPDAGVLGALARLESATFCVEYWKGE